MLVMRTSKKYRTDDINWLLKEIGVKDISEVNGMTVSEFVEKYADKHFSNICLDKLLEMGEVHVLEGQLLVKDLPISTRLKNILLRNDVYVLSDIVKYSREDIIRFRNLGEATLRELEELCEKEDIRIMSINEIADRMLGVRFTYHQLFKMFHMHIWYPEDFLNLTEEQITDLTQLDPGMFKKIKKVMEKNLS